MKEGEKARYGARLERRNAAFEAGEAEAEGGPGGDGDPEPADESALTPAELQDMAALLRTACRYGVMAGKLSPPLDSDSIRSIEEGITELYRSMVVLRKVRLGLPLRGTHSQSLSECLSV